MKKVILFIMFAFFSANFFNAQTTTGLELHLVPSTKVQNYSIIKLQAFLVNKSSSKIKTFSFGHGESGWGGCESKWEATLNDKPIKLDFFNDGPGAKFSLKNFTEVLSGDSIYAGYLEYKIEALGKYKITYFLSQNPEMVRLNWAANPESAEKAKQINSFAITSKPFEFVIEDIKIGEFEVKEITEAELDKKPMIENLATAFSNPSEVYKLTVKGNISEVELTKICALKNLRVLCFSDITGIKTFPDELSQLNLSELTFSGCNNLKYPTSLSKLSKLKQLTFSYSSLSEFPMFIEQLTNLEYLNISSCHISDIPDGIENLKNLKKLFLSGNDIIKLNPKIGNLTSLEYLSVSKYLSTFPDLSGCINLKYLDLSGNIKLTTIPPSIGKLKQLEEFRMTNTGLLEIPAEISNLKNIKTLILSYNQIAKISADLYKCSSIDYLELDNNMITEMEPGIDIMTNLRDLRLGQNYLKKLPSGLSKCPRLRMVSVQTNNIKDNDPEGKILTTKLGDNYRYKLKGK